MDKHCTNIFQSAACHCCGQLKGEIGERDVERERESLLPSLVERAIVVVVAAAAVVVEYT